MLQRAVVDRAALRRRARRTRTGRRAAPRPRWRRRRSPRRRRRGPAGCPRGRRARGRWSCASRAMPPTRSRASRRPRRAPAPRPRRATTRPRWRVARRGWGGACTGASSVMLTRVTVVARAVRLATPSLTCTAVSIRPRSGVEVFISFPNGHRPGPRTGHFSPRTGPRAPFLPPTFAGRPALGAVAPDQRGGPVFVRPLPLGPYEIARSPQGAAKVPAGRLHSVPLRSGTGQFLSPRHPLAVQSLRAAAPDQRGGPPSFLH